jgi:hypothetical protein
LPRKEKMEKFRHKNAWAEAANRLGFAILLLFLFGLLILTEAKRVHTDMYKRIHSLEYLHEGDSHE